MRVHAPWTNRITHNGRNGLSPILLSGGTSVGHVGLQLDLRWPNANAVSNLGAVGGRFLLWILFFSMHTYRSTDLTQFVNWWPGGSLPEGSPPLADRKRFGFLHASPWRVLLLTLFHCEVIKDVKMLSTKTGGNCAG